MTNRGLLLPCGRSVGDRRCEAVELCVKCNMRTRHVSARTYNCNRSLYGKTNIAAGSMKHASPVLLTVKQHRAYRV